MNVCFSKKIDLPKKVCLSCFKYNSEETRFQVKKRIEEKIQKVFWGYSKVRPKRFVSWGHQSNL